MRLLSLVASMVLIAGCQAHNAVAAESELTRKWWSLSFNEPFYMKAWVEDSAVEDIDGKLFRRTGGGTAAGGEPENGTESAQGWGVITGGVREVVGAKLPKRIFVRWQSIVEPQTYRTWIDIPEQARQIMRSTQNEPCPDAPDKLAGNVALVYIGVAPGGIVQVWVADKCMKAIKVARAQAEVEPLGPDQGKSQGQYAYPVSPKAESYIKKFGIPYGSW